VGRPWLSYLKINYFLFIVFASHFVYRLCPQLTLCIVRYFYSLPKPFSSREYIYSLATIKFNMPTALLGIEAGNLVQRVTEKVKRGPTHDIQCALRVLNAGA